MVQTAATAAVPPWADSMIQKWILYFERESIQRSIRDKVVDPILNHILKQVFPYILLICVMFVLLLFSVLITLGVILFQARTGPSAAGVVAS
jgi:hypothetical protein